MTIRLLYVDRSVHQAWPVARELELGRLCQESVTVAEVTMMEATCIGMVEKVDALGGVVQGPAEEGPVEERPENKVFERCSFRNWYMVLGYSSHRRPVEGRSIGLLEMDALGGPVEGRPSIKRIRRCSPNNTGVRGTTQGGRLTRGWRRNSLRCLLNETGGRMKQGGRLTSATRSLRSSESAVDTHEGKADESYERRFPWKGQSFSGSPVDKRPWQVDWPALPRHRFGGHWRWTRAVCIPGRNPVKFLHSPSSPKVGPKLGEQCRTQVPTSAGSGNLQPTLDEEPCAPSGARSACCLPLHWTVLHSLGERRDRVPGVPPVVLGDHAHHQVSPRSQTALAQLLQPRSMLACSTVPCIVPAPFYTISRGCSSMHTMVMTTIVSNTKGPTIFPLGALSTANRLD